MPAIVHQPVQNKKGIYQQKTYTVQFDDSDEQSLVHMQDLDYKSGKPKSPSEVSL